jgi:hypothetical protein
MDTSAPAVGLAAPADSVDHGEPSPPPTAATVATVDASARLTPFYFPGADRIAPREGAVPDWAFARRVLSIPPIDPTEVRRRSERRRLVSEFVSIGLTRRQASILARKVENVGWHSAVRQALLRRAAEQEAAAAERRRIAERAEAEREPSSAAPRRHGEQRQRPRTPHTPRRVASDRGSPDDGDGSEPPGAGGRRAALTRPTFCPPKKVPVPRRYAALRNWAAMFGGRSPAEQQRVYRAFDATVRRILADQSEAWQLEQEGATR